MKTLNLLFIIFVLVIFLVAIEFYFKQNVKQQSGLQLQLCNKTYFASIAADDYKRTVGFSNQKVIKDDQAILFVFPDEEIRYFWMKDTLFNLSIIFLDKDKKVVNFFDMQTCFDDKECQVYSSMKKAKYAIEIKKANLSCLQIGQQINFSD